MPLNQKRSNDCVVMSITTDANGIVSKSEFETNTYNWCQAQENACGQVAIDSFFRLAETVAQVLLANRPYSFYMLIARHKPRDILRRIDRWSIWK